MATRLDLPGWIVDALESSEGSATIVNICQHVWDHHEADLRASGSLFYTWQYDIRWAATRLRASGTMSPAASSRSGVWELA